MAELAAIAAAGGELKEVSKTVEAVITPAIKIVESTEKTAERLEEKAHKRATEVFKRDLPVFDYEKVFWNSTYSVGLFGLAWVAIKTGRLLIGLTNAVVSFGSFFDPLHWVIPEDVQANMDKCGTVINTLDDKVTGIAPVMPIGIVGLHTSIEYLRIRKNLPEQQRKAGDLAVGLGGMYAVYLAWEGLTRKAADPPGTVPPTTPEEAGTVLEEYYGFTLVNTIGSGRPSTVNYEIWKTCDAHPSGGDLLPKGKTTFGFYTQRGDEWAIRHFEEWVNSYWATRGGGPGGVG